MPRGVAGEAQIEAEPAGSDAGRNAGVQSRQERQFVTEGLMGRFVGGRCCINIYVFVMKVGHWFFEWCSIFYQLHTSRELSTYLKITRDNVMHSILKPIKLHSTRMHNKIVRDSIQIVLNFIYLV